ncbi:MAG: 50S ribosomal protein L3 [Candidatus Marinimicrobia bacterium]|nr:50S ribosomal protein L3 [Candidatus Neomarinimicrobiota bacterium]MDD9887430.1 50S ribosomal protein L3 [Candidatus Neomarinimicrobiota bacterium]MDD9930609.1 50S ribosomal protein L3 [Candidatus Neomarinimicrobiota bacterium]
MRGLIGKKIGMTQVFKDGDGQAVPVTVVEAGPCVVTQVKTQAKDGYDAVQVGFGERKAKHSNKALDGHFTKAGTDAKRFLAEFVPVPDYDYQTGQRFGVSLFKEGEYVDVAGTTKGHGFSGVMKRHGFGGGPKTHGQREHPRSAGSIGQASDPSRVFKGMKMAGQYGNKRMTVRNLEVVSIDKEKNQILLKGAIPGAKNGIIYITK